MNVVRSMRVGIALGSGGARGWSHVGVLRALEALGVRPVVVCGTSMGALVGATYASGHLEEFCAWGLHLSSPKVWALVDGSWRGGGLIRGKRLMRALQPFVPAQEISSLPVAYGAVATEIHTGREIWIRQGALDHAVRASISLPGMFVPVSSAEGWLVDGGLVNPVPVDFCRALGAEFVIGVQLLPAEESPAAPRFAYSEEGMRLLAAQLPIPLRLLLGEKALVLSEKLAGDQDGSPGLFQVLSSALTIMQKRIAADRIAADPPELLLCPHPPSSNLMDPKGIQTAIASGEACVQQQAASLRELGVC